MQFFRENLLDWGANTEFLLLLDKFEVPINKGWTVASIESQIDKQINDYTKKVANLPKLSQKQKDLSYFIHNQIKHDNNIFFVEQSKRKPSKKRIIKKSSNYSRDTLRECACCNMKYNIKHCCTHTTCQKPCRKQMRSDMFKKRSRNSRNQIVSNSSLSNKDSDLYKFDEDISENEDQSLHFSEFESEQLQSSLKVHKNQEEQKNLIRKLNRKIRQQDKNQSESKNQQSPMKMKSQKNINQLKLVQKQVQSSNKGIQQKQSKQKKEQNPEISEKKTRKKRQKVPIRKKKQKRSLQPGFSDNSDQSQFVPIDNLLESQIPSNKRGKSIIKKRKRPSNTLNSEASIGLNSNPRKRRSMTIQQPSSYSNFSSYISSPVREKRKLQDYCSLDELRQNKIFEVKLGEIDKKQRNIRKQKKKQANSNSRQISTQKKLKNKSRKKQKSKQKRIIDKNEMSDEKKSEKSQQKNNQKSIQKIKEKITEKSMQKIKQKIKKKSKQKSKKQNKKNGTPLKHLKKKIPNKSNNDKVKQSDNSYKIENYVIQNQQAQNQNIDHLNLQLATINNHQLGISQQNQDINHRQQPIQEQIRNFNQNNQQADAHNNKCKQAIKMQDPVNQINQSIHDLVNDIENSPINDYNHNLANNENNPQNQPNYKQFNKHNQADD